METLDFLTENFEKEGVIRDYLKLLLNIKNKESYE